MRTFLGKSDFCWPLMVLAEQWQCSLYANVLFVQSSVPTMFLHFLQTDGLQTDGSRLFRDCYHVQKEHAKKFSIKNLGAPQDSPPPRNSLRGPSSSIPKGKEAPNIKNSRGQGSLQGGSGRGVSAQILYVYALFWFLMLGSS